MENYILSGTKSKPYIELNCQENKLVFKGQSYPENAYSLYEPVYKWVDEYLSSVGDVETTVEFYLSYINTSSTKCLLTLLEKLNTAYLQGKKLLINWYYDEDNGFDYDMGVDFKEDIDIPFSFISITDAT